MLMRSRQPSLELSLQRLMGTNLYMKHLIWAFHPCQMHDSSMNR